MHFIQKAGSTSNQTTDYGCEAILSLFFSFFIQNTTMPKHICIIGLAIVGLASCQNQSSISTSAPTTMTNTYYSRTDTTKLNVSDAEWKKVLPDSIYQVARKKDTERAFTGKYWNYTGLGTYYCAACGNKLFKSNQKFVSSCGWPRFRGKGFKK